MFKGKHASDPAQDDFFVIRNAKLADSFKQYPIQASEHSLDFLVTFSQGGVTTRSLLHGYTVSKGLSGIRTGFMNLGN